MSSSQYSQNFGSDLTKQLRKTLQSSNDFMITQIEKNKKYINSLQQFLAWISSCPVSVSPELTSLLLSNHQVPEEFDYEILLKSELNKYICKSKYFSFIIELHPITLQTIQPDTKIPIEVKIYTSESLPKQIITTMQGKKITRGKAIEHLTYNVAENKFSARIKMQITEVSSHFVNGTISLVVEKTSECEHRIKPLVIKDIIIKAKEKTCQRWREEGC